MNKEREKRAEIKKDVRDCTVCPRSSEPFYVETYYIKWVTTS